MKGRVRSRKKYGGYGKAKESIRTIIIWACGVSRYPPPFDSSLLATRAIFTLSLSTQRPLETNPNRSEITKTKKSKTHTPNQKTNDNQQKLQQKDISQSKSWIFWCNFRFLIPKRSDGNNDLVTPVFYTQKDNLI